MRSALPVHEGEPFPPPGVHSDPLERRVSDRVKEITGRTATDIAFVCCDSKQNYMAYIGLQGASYQELRFDPAPRGSIRLPKEAMKLGDRMGDAWAKAVMNGHAEEDDSTGYALTKDPGARKAELVVRDYALENEPLLLKVLASSSDAEHRATAAVMLGYSRQSNEQIDALVRASLDPDGDVRNNAVRALEVLAGAKPELAQRIPIGPFVRLLRSGAWTDHNKASLLPLR
jgi:HEAT repeats